MIDLIKKILKIFIKLLILVAAIYVLIYILDYFNLTFDFSLSNIMYYAFIIFALWLLAEFIKG